MTDKKLLSEINRALKWHKNNLWDIVELRFRPTNIEAELAVLTWLWEWKRRLEGE